MWCCLRRRQSPGGGARAEKHRELEAMPQRRDLSAMPSRREQAAVPPQQRRIPRERRETVRATTEFKWPPRMGDVMLSPRLANYHQYAQTRPMADDTSEKEAALVSPTSFHFAPEPVYLEQEYHISPQVSQDMLSHKFKYGPGASLPDLAELPPNELVLEQVHELAGPTPPLIFPQELEGSPDVPQLPRLPRSTTPTSRFSSRR